MAKKRQEPKTAKPRQTLTHRVTHLDMLDIQLIKLAIIPAVFLALKLWPALMLWVYKTNIWWFFAALVLFGARPFIKYWMSD